MLNWMLVALLLAALVGLGGLAMIIDSGVEDKHKQRYVYALFSLFGVIALVFAMVEDKSAFIYGDWQVEKKKKKKDRGNQVVDDDDGGPGEDPSTEKRSSGSAPDDDGSKSKGGGSGFADGRDCDVCPPMVKMVGGKTVIGTLFRDAGQGGPVLGALQEVEAQPYAISRMEITVAQYEAFVKEKSYAPPAGCRVGKDIVPEASYRAPGFEQSPDHPVVCLRLVDAIAYTDWLSEKSGQRYALPTEIEWEHAARASSLDSYTTGRQIHPGQANFRAVGSVLKGTVRAGSYAPNSYGLHDVHGNAAEMLGDCWDKKAAPPAATPVAAAPGGAKAGDTPAPAQATAIFNMCKTRVVKGGSWQSTAGHLHFAARAPYQVNDQDNSIGFRVVRRAQ